MAFNFDWSRWHSTSTIKAREYLTAALNKYPKPPIIVDDIIVTELNLGSTPPELEIRDIGDLAEDRFRGIFKMSYAGDAFMTLKTKVQANPLKTHLLSKPEFASPQPLAASSGLTIPLQITLSDIRLSGVVILVFSRQKGLTLVFQDEPLQSLKVSSTFDSIPFVRDYLQKEIEKQLRNLFMDDLPAILHRLSLRLWSPEYQEMDDENLLNRERDTTPPIDPLATPPQDAVDPFGNPLDDDEMSGFSLDKPYETHASFSQKNLLRLAALTESHHTLALFTPSIRDAIFRAWAKTTDRADHSAAHTPTFSLSRAQSSANVSSSASLSDGSEIGSTSTRPTIYSFHSSQGLGAGRQKKRKRRVVNLRRDNGASDSAGEAAENSASAPSSAPPSLVPEEKEDVSTPENTPPRKAKAPVHDDYEDSPRITSPSGLDNRGAMLRIEELTRELNALPVGGRDEKSATVPSTPTRSSRSRSKLQRAAVTPDLSKSEKARLARQPATPAPSVEAPPGGILEQAWMAKMAAEINRRVQEEKARGNGAFWGRSSRKGDGIWDVDVEDTPPPAYSA